MKNSFYENIVMTDKFIAKVEMAASCLLLVAIVIIVGLGVFMRYVLNNPLVASTDLSTLILVWMSFIAASAIYKEKGHLAIEFISDRIPSGLRKITLLAVNIIIAATLIVIMIHTIRLVLLQWGQEIIGLGVPRCLLSLPIVIMSTLMFLTTIQHVITEFRKLP